MALTASTGSELWTWTRPDSTYDTINTIKTDGTTVLARGYGTHGNGDVFFALDAQNGRPLWQKNGHVPAAMAEGSVLIPGDGVTDVFTAATGQKRWTVPTTDSIDVYKDVVLVNHDASIEAWSLETGGNHWSLDFGLIGEPVQVGDLLIAQIHQYPSDIVAVDLHTGKVTWRQPGSLIGTLRGAPLIQVEGYTLHRLDPATGTSQWSFPVPEAILPMATPAQNWLLLTSMGLNAAGEPHEELERTYAVKTLF
ncbi:PQQ-binding-like beta-propeller repeat protein [Kitasatospora aburaviensis]